MSVKKTNRASSFREVLKLSLQLALGAIAGVVICAVWLVFKPAVIADAPPKTKSETDIHEVVYVRGRPATRSNQGAAKHKAFLSRTPGELAFIEEDVNRWLTSAYGANERSYVLKGTGATLFPRIPSARVNGDVLELGLEVSVERGESKHTMVAQAHGRFAERNGVQVFVPHKVYLGSCPLPWNLGGKLVYEKVLALHPVPENISKAWSAVSSAKLAEGRLRLAIGGAGLAPVAPAAVAPATTPIAATTPPAIVSTPPTSAPTPETAAPTPEAANELATPSESTAAPAPVDSATATLPVPTTESAPVAPATTDAAASSADPAAAAPASPAPVGTETPATQN